MLEFNNNKNLLMQARYQYELQDVKEPNLYRDIFDYQSIPKVPFNMRTVPMDMPEEIWMNNKAGCRNIMLIAPCFNIAETCELVSAKCKHSLEMGRGCVVQ